MIASGAEVRKHFLGAALIVAARQSAFFLDCRVRRGPPWATLALESGYADQPHMVREFREFSGQSPTERQTAAPGDLARNFVSPRRLAALLGSA